MRTYWEKLGILGPIYHLVGRGLSNQDIAAKLNITDVNVENCISWLLRFLHYNSRAQLVLRAANTPGTGAEAY